MAGKLIHIEGNYLNPKYIVNVENIIKGRDEYYFRIYYTTYRYEHDVYISNPILSKLEQIKSEIIIEINTQLEGK